MEKTEEENIYIRILKFWKEHPKGFSYNELTNIVKPNEWENNLIQKYMYHAVLNSKKHNTVLHETIFLESRISKASNKQYWNSDLKMLNEDFWSEAEDINYAISDAQFSLKYDAYFNYIDYLELQKAIDNSKQASKQAKIAIYVAVWLGLIQIWIQIYEAIIK